MTSPNFRGPPFLRRLVLLVALASFLLPAAVGPLATVCVCLTGGRTAIAAGGCCCELQAFPEDPAPANRCASDETETPCRDCGAPEPCTCLDLHGADHPAALDRSADPLPEPVPAALLPDMLPTEPFSCLAGATFRVRPPPEPPPAPVRHRVLRC